MSPLLSSQKEVKERERHRETEKKKRKKEATVLMNVKHINFSCFFTLKAFPEKLR